MSEITVTYDTEILDGQDDSAWYCYGDTNKVATVTNGVKEFQVFAVGEMRLHVPVIEESGEWRGDVYDVVRYTDTLLGYAETDTELETLTQDWLGRGVDIWVNNNWFEVVEVVDGAYDDDGYVVHSLTQAVEQAKEFLVQVP